MSLYRPQLISVEFYAPTSLDPHAVKRQAINKKYDIPCFDFPALFPNSVPPMQSKYYVSNKLDAHPVIECPPPPSPSHSFSIPNS